MFTFLIIFIVALVIAFDVSGAMWVVRRWVRIMRTPTAVLGEYVLVGCLVSRHALEGVDGCRGSLAFEAHLHEWFSEVQGVKTELIL